MNSSVGHQPRAAGRVLDQRHAPHAVWAIWLFASSLVGFVIFAITHPAFADKCDDFHTPPDDLTARLIFGSVLVASAVVGVGLRRRMRIAWMVGGLVVQAFVFWSVLQPPAGIC